MARKPSSSKAPRAGDGEGAEPTPGPGSLPRIAIVHGEDAFLRQEKTRELREALTRAHGELDVFTFDGAAAQPSEVLDECRSFGLMAPHKFVVVDAAEALVKEAARPLFERYAQSPAEQATLVLRSAKWHAGNLDKLVAKVGVVEKCDSPTPKEALGWLSRRAKDAHGATIDADAANALLARVGVALMQLDSELAKLATVASAGGAQSSPRITLAHVAQFVGVSREEEAWNIQGSLLSGNPEAALAHLRHVLEVSRQPAQLVMYAMTDLARKLHTLSAGVRAGENPADLSRTLRLWGPSQAALPGVAARLSPSQTLRFFRACVQADMRSKSGLSDTPRALEALALDLQRMLSRAS